MKMTGRVLTKKNIVIIFAMILSVAFLPVTVYAAEASVTFGSERYDKNNGEQFPVGVYLNGDGTMADYHVELRYDSLRLKYISGADEADEENGVLIFEGSASAEQVKLWLTFEAVSGGEACLSVDTAEAEASDGSSFRMTLLQEVSVYIDGEDTAAEIEAAREAVNAGAVGGREPGSGSGDGAGAGGETAAGGAEPGSGDGAAGSGAGVDGREPESGSGDEAVGSGSGAGVGTAADVPESGAGNGTAADGPESDNARTGISGEQDSAAAAGDPEVSVGQASAAEDSIDSGSKASNGFGFVIVLGIVLICVVGILILIMYLCSEKRENKRNKVFRDKEGAAGRRKNRDWEYDENADYDENIEYIGDSETEYDWSAEYAEDGEYAGDAEYAENTEHVGDAEYAENTEHVGDVAYDENTEHGRNTEYAEDGEYAGNAEYVSEAECDWDAGYDENTESNEGSDAAAEEESELPVIKVDNVTMKFKVATGSTSGLKDYLIQKLKKQISTRDLLALDAVSFEVFKGEVVGIIGTNGSGKSTLLKIISGAMKPTGGQVIVDKSKIQLLTLGTGFDMELSARENVYLNGAIIGYSKEFLDKHYDEIVAFAELEGFMDTKVKNFSSGMVSRLGFAIATAGDAAEILILDEVLSVGDEFFRKKSLKRIKEMIHGGSTVIMVSHGMGTIMENCTKVVWIEKGVLQMAGDPRTVCMTYRKMGES